MSAELLNLPWGIQVSLASGYAAYIIAYTGLRDRHRTIDTVFITLVFGLMATAVLALTSSWPATVSGALAFTASILVGLGWRKWGRMSLRNALRHVNITWSDDDPSALATLSANVRYPVTQIAVLLDDGTWLRCDDTTKFSNAPYGPCLIGPGGDVAMYLTHEEPAGATAKELKTVCDPAYGERITYIPASRIRRFAIRHKKPVNRP